VIARGLLICQCPRSPQLARRKLALESAIERLDRFDLLILDASRTLARARPKTSALFSSAPVASEN
jgi:hypothetical protein